MSLRRAQGLYTQPRKAGKISRIPGINAASSFFKDEESTDALNGLIAKVSLPLAALEEKLAIDASGFRTTSFNHYRKEKYEPLKRNVWEKCHIIVGVHTNVIPAVIVTDGNAPDGAQFPELLESAFKLGFNVRQVFADKAYLSRNNFAVAASLNVDAVIPFKSNSRGKSHGVPVWHRKFLEWQPDPGCLEQNGYFLRENVESDFSAIKRMFGETIRSRNPTAMRNELLCKVFVYAVALLIHAMHLSDRKISLHDYSPPCTNNTTVSTAFS